eukprot:gb/GECG01016625.1/.p1 GENE.gb/GECG01016625.1/~~gb/GECG01016625.1/.p1  ORF type:complete len:146 (+),score=6.69 gb/GECG01016625.1/:1-438(+)
MSSNNQLITSSELVNVVQTHGNSYQVHVINPIFLKNQRTTEYNFFLFTQDIHMLGCKSCQFESEFVTTVDRMEFCDPSEHIIELQTTLVDFLDSNSCGRINTIHALPRGILKCKASSSSSRVVMTWWVLVHVSSCNFGSLFTVVN